MALHLTEKKLDDLVNSPRLKTAAQEPDLMARAQKLFGLKEDLYDARDAQEQAADAAASKKSRRAAKIGLGVGIALLIPVVALVGMHFAVGGAIGWAVETAAGGSFFAGVLGVATRDVVNYFSSSRPRDKAQREIDKNFDTLDKGIDGEIKKIDAAVTSSPAETLKTAFRSAFDFATRKIELRDNARHRSHMAEQAEITAENSAIMPIIFMNNMNNLPKP